MLSGNETVSGTIENVVYYNEETDYAVLEISDENGLLITAVGTVPIPAEGEYVSLRGKWGYHKEFGKQFVIENFEKTLTFTVKDYAFDIQNMYIDEEIADSTSLNRVTVSRIISDLKQQKLINVRYGNIEIINRNELKKLLP